MKLTAKQNLEANIQQDEFFLEQIADCDQVLSDLIKDDCTYGSVFKRFLQSLGVKNLPKETRLLDARVTTFDGDEELLQDVIKAVENRKKRIEDNYNRIAKDRIKYYQ